MVTVLKTTVNPDGSQQYIAGETKSDRAYTVADVQNRLGPKDGPGWVKASNSLRAAGYADQSVPTMDDHADELHPVPKRR